MRLDKTESTWSEKVIVRGFVGGLTIQEAEVEDIEGESYTEM